MFGTQGKHFFRAATEIGGGANEQQRKTGLKQKQVRFQHMIAAMNTPAVLPNGQPNPTAKTTLIVMRDRILESSVQPWLGLKNEQLRGRLLFKFHGEEGKDWGGLAKEWTVLIIEVSVRVSFSARFRR